MNEPKPQTIADNPMPLELVSPEKLKDGRGTFTRVNGWHSSLAELVALYMRTASPTWSPKTKSLTTTALLRWQEWMSKRSLKADGDVPWMQIMVNAMQDYVDDMVKRGLAANTITASMINPVSKFFNWCVLMGYCSGNPAQFVKKPKAVKKRWNLYTVEEYEKMKAHTVGHVMHYAIVAAYRTSMSLCDCCLLRWDSVDMNECIITMARHKMRAVAGAGLCRIPFEPLGDLHLVLKELHAAIKPEQKWPDPSFVSPELAMLYMRGYMVVSDYFSRVLKRCCITGKSFHSFRRTGLSALANSGTNMAIACEISGHSNPAQLKAYVVADDDALREAVRGARKWGEKTKVKSVIY